MLRLYSFNSSPRISLSPCWLSAWEKNYSGSLGKSDHPLFPQMLWLLKYLASLKHLTITNDVCQMKYQRSTNGIM